MPVNNRIADRQDEIAGWRRHLHQIPEILYDVHETAAFVAAKLAAFGCDEVVTGIGRTGVVGVIHGRNGPGRRRIALRADMDALPIVEETGAAYASLTPGAMHACGHDGHMAMLLGAAESLCETRGFEGSVVVVFQPAEEGGAGAKAMIDDGLMERFAIDEVYGMHNIPGLPLGHFAICPGPIMASTDTFVLTLRGRGSHAAIPQQGLDPILAGAALVQALQQIVARNTDPLQSLVVSVTEFHAGFTSNVIPETAVVSGTVRALTAEMRDLAERRMGEIAEGIGVAHGVAIELRYDRHYPVTFNHAGATGFCAAVAAEIVPAAQVDTAVAPLMGGEDFSYMLEARPGAFIFVGNGDTAGLHHPKYDFDDRAIAYGASYWVRLAERALAGA
jgi:hippurate hydrolase